MKRVTFIALGLLFVAGCQDQRKAQQPEPWVSQPVSEWPEFNSSSIFHLKI
ncbi:lipoprotein [Marinilabilia sp.]